MVVVKKVTFLVLMAAAFFSIDARNLIQAAHASGPAMEPVLGESQSGGSVRG